MFGTTCSQIDDDGDFQKQIDIFWVSAKCTGIFNWTSVGLSFSLLATGSKAHVFLQRECRRDATLYSRNIWRTRSYAALRAADLDWIVGPGYSLGRVHSGEKPWKTNLEPWKTMETNQKPWKTMKLPWKTMETNQKPWKTLKLRDVTHTGSQLTSMIKKTWRDPHGVPTDLLDV